VKYIMWKCAFVGTVGMCKSFTVHRLNSMKQIQKFINQLTAPTLELQIHSHMFQLLSIAILSKQQY